MHIIIRQEKRWDIIIEKKYDEINTEQLWEVEVWKKGWYRCEAGRWHGGWSDTRYDLFLFKRKIRWREAGEHWWWGGVIDGKEVAMNFSAGCGCRRQRLLWTVWKAAASERRRIINEERKIEWWEGRSRYVKKNKCVFCSVLNKVYKPWNSLH